MPVEHKKCRKRASESLHLCLLGLWHSRRRRWFMLSARFIKSCTRVRWLRSGNFTSHRKKEQQARRRGNIMCLSVKWLIFSCLSSVLWANAPVVLHRGAWIQFVHRDLHEPRRQSLTFSVLNRLCKFYFFFLLAKSWSRSHRNHHDDARSHNGSIYEPESLSCMARLTDSSFRLRRQLSWPRKSFLQKTSCRGFYSNLGLFFPRIKFLFPHQSPRWAESEIMLLSAFNCSFPPSSTFRTENLSIIYRVAFI